MHIFSGIPLRYKKNERVPFAATRMDLEIIILNGMSQKEKGKSHIVSLIGRIQRK